MNDGRAVGARCVVDPEWARLLFESQADPITAAGLLESLLHTAWLLARAAVVMVRHRNRNIDMLKMDILRLVL